MKPVLAPAFDVHRVANVPRKNISDVQLDYRRNRGVSDDDGGLPSDFPAEVVDDLNDNFKQKALWETGGGSSFSADDRSAIGTALQRLSRTVLTSGAAFTDVIRSFIDDIELSRAATTEADREVERKKVPVSVAKK